MSDIKADILRMVAIGDELAEMRRLLPMRTADLEAALATIEARDATISTLREQLANAVEWKERWVKISNETEQAWQRAESEANTLRSDLDTLAREVVAWRTWVGSINPHLAVRQGEKGNMQYHKEWKATTDAMDGVDSNPRLRAVLDGAKEGKQ